MKKREKAIFRIIKGFTAKAVADGTNFCSSSLSELELELSESEWAAKNRDIFGSFLQKKSKNAQKTDVKEFFSWRFARFLVCRKRPDITSVESAGLPNCSTSLLSISLNLKFYPK